MCSLQATLCAKYVTPVSLPGTRNVLRPNENAVQKGRRFLFGSGGALCTLARSPEPLAVLEVPLIAA